MRDPETDRLLTAVRQAVSDARAIGQKKEAQMNVTKIEEGRVSLSVPLPLYGLLRKGCLCGKGFWTLKGYERHYFSTHAGVRR